MKDLTSEDIARYFLGITDEDAGETISNLKLQKLVYYAQGFHLALYDKPLFNEQIVAWLHGPVVRALYHQYSKHGSNSIPLPKDVDFEIYPKTIKDLLNEIYEVFGQYSAWKLREMTHDEPPWKKAYQTHDKIISQKDLKDYFRTQVENGKTEE